MAEVSIAHKYKKPKRNGAAHLFVPMRCEASGRVANANSFSFSSSLSFPFISRFLSSLSFPHPADRRCAAHPDENPPRREPQASATLADSSWPTRQRRPQNPPRSARSHRAVKKFIEILNLTRTYKNQKSIEGAFRTT